MDVLEGTCSPLALPSSSFAYLDGAWTQETVSYGDTNLRTGQMIMSFNWFYLLLSASSLLVDLAQEEKKRKVSRTGTEPRTCIRGFPASFHDVLTIDQ